MNRCRWVNLNNPLYVKYHDEEWGIPSYNDSYLFEMLLLESFQAGLSWECILNKREYFRKAYDFFDVKKVSLYDENKIQELLLNPNIIRNKLKIRASIINAKVFIDIQKEYGSFANYIWSFNKNEVYVNKERGTTFNDLSDRVSQDLRKRGMKFVGTTIIYSYLQAIGMIWDHDIGCDFIRDN